MMSCRHRVLGNPNVSAVVGAWCGQVTVRGDREAKSVKIDATRVSAFSDSLVLH